MRLKLLPVALIAVGLAVSGLQTNVAAQGYPERPVRLLIAFPAGGTIDTLGRILAQKLTEAWGQNVVIENRPGAGGNIGAAAAAKAPADGYTLHLGAQTLAVNVTLQPSTEFDPVKDFEPIMLVATAQDVLLVPPNSPFRSVKELIDYAKAHPGELNYASLGTGTSGHRRHLRPHRGVSAHPRRTSRQRRGWPHARARRVGDDPRHAASRCPHLQ